MGKQRHFYHVGQILSSGLFSRFGLPLILLAFLVLSSLHSIVVPITQGEDELAHYRYISFIAQNGRLPVNQDERQQAWYRADWPPLYHVLVGWAVSSFDTSRPHLKDVGESPRRRLVGEIFYPRLIIYTEDANWPWQDGILAWHLGRFISILFSGTALIFTYLTVLEFCRGTGPEAGQSAGQKPALSPCATPSWLALSTTALLAFTPRFLFTSAMLGDDSLFILLSASFIWLLLRALRGDDRWAVYAGLGLLLGLSITTKYSTGLLPLVIIPVVLWRARRLKWRRVQWLGRVGLAWLFTGLGSAWWFGWIGYYFNTIKENGFWLGLLRSILDTGPDVSMRRIFAILDRSEFSGSIRPEAIAGGSFWEWLTYLFQTFWGVPVLEYDPLYPWVYLIMLFFCLLALIGLRQFWRIANSQIRITLVILGLIVGLLLPFPLLRYFLTFNVLETGQGRHILYPAAQSIPLLLMLGWTQITVWTYRQIQSPDRTKSKVSSTVDRLPITHHHLLRFLPYGLVVILFLWSVFQLVYMRITYPAPLPVQTTTFNRNSVPHPAALKIGDSIELLGYDFQPNPEQAVNHLTLFWKTLKAVDENYRIRIQWVATSTGQPHFVWLSHPVNGLYPTRAWDEGDVIRDRLTLPLAAMPPNSYQIQLDLLHEAEDTLLNREPIHLGQFDLTETQAMAKASTLVGDNPEYSLEYRLWIDDTPVRYRQTVPLSWRFVGTKSNQQPDWILLGPDKISRQPVAMSDVTAIFMIGADWPSGDYRLGLGLGGDVTQTDTVLSVANQARNFSPSKLEVGGEYVSVEANFGGQIKLLGYTLPARYLEPGDHLPLNLAWQSLAPVLPDIITFAVLLDVDQQPYGNVDRYPVGFYSPMLWAEGEVVFDSFKVPIHPDAPPGIYYLHVGQYKVVDGQPQSLPLFHQGEPTGNTAVVIGPIKIGGPPPGLTVQNPAPQIPLNQTLGGQITLLGYDLVYPNSNHDSQNLKLTLYWQANIDLHTDYTTFFHLRNMANETVAQKDAPPAAGRYPTSLWSMGEIVVDEIILPLEQVAPGEYVPVVGLYNFASLERLSPNEIVLQPLTVEE